jgi:ADP-ribose pyrophosphatase
MSDDRRVEIVERRRVHDGFFKFDLLKVRHALFRGGMSEVLRRELFVQRDAVSVLPYDPVRDAVVLVEQFRAGLVDVPGRGAAWSLEGVAGLLDKEGEAPEEAAAREVREECGLGLGRLERVATYTSSPGATTERVHAFVGEVDAAGAGGVHGVAGEHEDIRTEVVPAERAFDLLREGRIAAANTVIPLQHLMMHRGRLRQAWAGRR